MRPTRKCDFCGKTFVPRSGMQKYYSEECQAEAKRLRKKRQQDLINGIEPIMDLQHQEYLTFSKAAILMGCTRQYIYKLVANGKLKASRLSSRMAFVRKEQVQQLYGLTSANICHIVRAHHISKVKVGVKNLLLKTDVERAMAERAAKGL